MNRPDRCHAGNIDRLIDLAMAGESGRNWYREARADLIQCAIDLECTAERLADLLAVFSPRLSVTRSIKMMLQWQRTRRFTDDCIRSTRAAVDFYERTGTIRGPKTSAFAAALKGDEHAVVLDVWMARALGVDQRELKGERYLDTCEIVKTVAYVLDWTPAETQAAVWCGTVMLAGRNPPRLVVSRFMETQ